jgi:hypothetical protein
VITVILGRVGIQKFKEEKQKKYLDIVRSIAQFELE